MDASPPDMWEFRGWKKLPQNRNLRHPVVLTPHLMYHLYRDPKFIVLLREPVEKYGHLFVFLPWTLAVGDSDVDDGDDDDDDDDDWSEIL